MITVRQHSSPTSRPRPEAGPPNYRLKLLSAVNSMPPLPTVLNQLMSMLNSENTSAGQVAAVIERDSVLSGSVLRCVNSAYYGVQTRVSSIRHAVTLLGFPTVRNLALAFSMRRMMAKSQPTRELYANYSKHALACAIMTQFLATLTRAEDQEASFAGGLFHDIGRLLVLTTIPEVMPKLVEAWEAGEQSLENVEREILEVSHSELSAIVLQGWKLPETLTNAARYHHGPEACPGADQGVTLAKLVSAADLAVNFQGLATIASDKRPPASPERALAELGVSFEQIRPQFEKEFASIQQIFGSSAS